MRTSYLQWTGILHTRGIFELLVTAWKLMLKLCFQCHWIQHCSILTSDFVALSRLLLKVVGEDLHFWSQDKSSSLSRTWMVAICWWHDKTCLGLWLHFLHHSWQLCLDKKEVLTFEKVQWSFIYMLGQISAFYVVLVLTGLHLMKVVGAGLYLHVKLLFCSFDLKIKRCITLFCGCSSFSTHVN